MKALLGGGELRLQFRGQSIVAAAQRLRFGDGLSLTLLKRGDVALVPRNEAGFVDWQIFMGAARASQRSLKRINACLLIFDGLPLLS